MSLHTRRITVTFALLLVVSLAGAAAAVRKLDHLRAGATLEESLLIPSPKALKRMSLGYTGLLADIYWTRAVQYFGTRHHAKSARYDQLAPLLDITTDLDPQLLVAYQFGSVFLSQQPPEGAGQPRAAVALVEKGIRANPKNYQLYFNLGWIQASELKDYAAASQAFERGSKIEGAAPGLKVLAAAMAQHGGETQVARYMWKQLYDTTEDRTLRANAVKRLQALQVDEDVVALEQALAAYKRSTGAFPATWAELEATGWRGPTRDPLGHPYKIAINGRVEVADPDQLPFITKGLPPGKEPALFAQTEKQKQAIRDAASDKPSGSATPESKK